MFTLEIHPRFSDTDALGHISNTSLPVWFEQGRTPIFEIFHPSLDVKTWPLILARLEIDLLAQSYWHLPVEIRTGIGKIGNSSCHVVQEAWQNGTRVARVWRCSFTSITRPSGRCRFRSRYAASWNATGCRRRACPPDRLGCSRR